MDGGAIPAHAPARPGNGPNTGETRLKK